ncbi:hypothetical protein J6590_043789 [Homalodisca vitripennis]|nr:hypothetical protein J6590_043789 [Homalodisca vitripennis]
MTEGRDRLLKKMDSARRVKENHSAKLQVVGEPTRSGFSGGFCSAVFYSVDIWSQEEGSSTIDLGVSYPFGRALNSFVGLGSAQPSPTPRTTHPAAPSFILCCSKVSILRENIITLSS